MNQATLNLPAPKEQMKYPNGFWTWMDKKQNQDIYFEFVKRAKQMAQVRKRYSARAIVHAIRWDTDLQDSDVQFRINNNYISGMARLFMKLHGADHPKFFQLRDSLGMDE